MKAVRPRKTHRDKMRQILEISAMVEKIQYNTIQFS